MNNKKPYIKFMPYHSIRNASRNIRELSVAEEMGFEPVVFSHDRPGECEPVAVWQYRWDGSSPIRPVIPKMARILMIFFYRLVVIKRTFALPTGVWSCHDLQALSIACLASRLRRRKPVLIYDSHEFELGRNKKRSRFARWHTKKTEKRLMKRCAFSIVVNDSIADEVQRIYKLEERPIVVRSTPQYWEIDEAVCRRQRDEFLKTFIELAQ